MAKVTKLNVKQARAIEAATLGNGRGVTYTVNGDTLTIMIDVSKAARANAPLSSTQKSLIVASTGGTARATLPDGSTISVTLAAFTKAPKA
jgi:hypothetical protein